MKLVSFLTLFLFAPNLVFSHEQFREWTCGQPPKHLKLQFKDKQRALLIQPHQTEELKILKRSPSEILLKQNQHHMIYRLSFDNNGIGHLEKEHGQNKQIFSCYSLLELPQDLKASEQLKVNIKPMKSLNLDSQSIAPLPDKIKIAPSQTPPANPDESIWKMQELSKKGELQGIFVKMYWGDFCHLTIKDREGKIHDFTCGTHLPEMDQANLKWKGKKVKVQWRHVQWSHEKMQESFKSKRADHIFEMTF